MIEIPKKEPLNIVPFIDIMLVLLAMVLSISTFIAKGEIQINLPQTESSQASGEKEKPILVQVNAEGEFYWDGQSVSVENLEDKVKALNSNDRVLMRIDKESKFDSFVQVIDLFKKYDHENFAIATEQITRP